MKTPTMLPYLPAVFHGTGVILLLWHHWPDVIGVAGYAFVLLGVAVEVALRKGGYLEDEAATPGRRG